MKNKLIIFSTHILQLAIDLCDEIVVMSDGFEEKVIELLKDDEND